MLKVWNKALIYRDLKAIWWFLPIVFFELFLFYDMHPEIYEDFDPRSIFINSINGIGTIVFLSAVTLTLFMMSKVLFRFERNREYYTFSASMPFTKKQILGSKLLAGIFTITSAFIVQYIILYYLSVRHSYPRNYFHEYSLRYVSIYMMVMFVFVFIIMLNSANLWGLKVSPSQPFLSAVPITVLMVLYWLFSYLEYLRRKYFQYCGFYIGEQVHSYFYGAFMNILWGVHFSFNTQSGALSIRIIPDAIRVIYDGDAEDVYILTPVHISCGIYLVLIIGLLFLSFFLFKRKKYNSNYKTYNSSVLKDLIRFVTAFAALVFIVFAAAVIQCCIKIV